ncbi:hypothetical protein SAMN05443248_5368 [Bradyrhizobium erythrophlei]|uniref:Uncharacterized protein n=1 Tax=Bradyrhizobium erythrophlei TaxID=1437360 RepID=A0A1M5UBX0_9BRAD|nr:hypothetical protein SAMN05443248_5368 [Bradyrhizobium erythrophlei]
MVLSMAVALEHDPEKWKPVFRKDHVLASSMRALTSKARRSAAL